MFDFKLPHGQNFLICKDFRSREIMKHMKRRCSGTKEHTWTTIGKLVGDGLTFSRGNFTPLPVNKEGRTKRK
jgi:hypothetical protein